jgi:hypothetical protein
MLGIYDDISETNYVSRSYNVAAILWLKHMIHVLLYPTINDLYFYISISEVCARCSIWHFSVTP